MAHRLIQVCTDKNRLSQAPKFRTLAITIYCYHNLDLTVMIAKIVQNVLETPNNENNIL